MGGDGRDGLSRDGGRGAWGAMAQGGSGGGLGLRHGVQHDRGMPPRAWCARGLGRLGLGWLGLGHGLGASLPGLGRRQPAPRAAAATPAAQALAAEAHPDGRRIQPRVVLDGPARQGGQRGAWGRPQ